MKLSYHVVISVLLTLPAAIGAPAESSSTTDALEKVFDVGFKSQKNGGMQGHQQDMEKIYYETLSVLKGTVKALDFLLDLKSEPTSSTKDAHQKYLRVAQPFKLLLGNEDVWTKRGVNPMVKEARGIDGQLIFEI